MKLSENHKQTLGTCTMIFIVPDTNVWFNKREQLLSILEQYKDFVTIALPHIMIDEGLPETYKRAVLYKVDQGITYQQFRQKLMDSILNTITRGFSITVAHVPGIWGITRLDFMYCTSKEDNKVLDLIVCEYVSKGRRYYTTLKQVIRLLYKLIDLAKNELRRIEEEIDKGLCNYDRFATVIKWCSSFSYEMGDEQLRSNTRRLLGILADALIIASCINLAKTRKCKSVICVSDDDTLLCVLKKVCDQLKISNVYGYELSCKLRRTFSQLIPTS